MGKEEGQNPSTHVGTVLLWVCNACIMTPLDNQKRLDCQDRKAKATTHMGDLGKSGREAGGGQRLHGWLCHDVVMMTSDSCPPPPMVPEPSLSWNLGNLKGNVGAYLI